MKKLIAIFALLNLIFCSPIHSVDENNIYHYYCTVSDDAFFPLLQNLIGSIHKEDFEALDEIAVFDIGMTQEQITYLSRVAKVKVYSVEKRNPAIFTYFLSHPWGRLSRGWYSWKPVAIKQALDLFPYILFLDAGTTVLASPTRLFKHIEQNGYFFLELENHPLEERLTQTVLEKIVLALPTEQQKKILSQTTNFIDAGFQGLSRAVYATYVFPVYDLASDISVFEDDHSARLGFGSARHDQTLFSIYNHLNGYRLNSQGWSFLNIDGKKVPFHMHWHGQHLNKKTCIYRSRWDFESVGSRQSFVRMVD